MAANLADHQVIRLVKNKSVQGVGMTRSFPEKAGKTFLAGTPVQLTGGYLLDWDGATVAAGILGIAPSGGANLGSDGLGAPGAFGSVGAPGTTTTYGSVPYQTSAYNIPVGAPFSDGRALVFLAERENIFEAQIDNSAAGAYATTVALVGAQYGMTKDATGHWYVDLNKPVGGGAAVVTIVAINPIDGVGVNGGRVWFSFIDSAIQIAP